jgi:dihydrolipoamide dehydrogenase
MGVAPNLEGLGLEKLGIELDKRGVPDFNPATSQVADLPVYIAGDSNGCRPILHEALDEGYIAGNNASPKEPSAYCRRTPLRMVFSDPQIAVVGRPYSNLEDANADVAIGEADFAEQSRAVVEGANHGLLRVYVERNTARLLGAEMAVPAAEHLGHILSLAIQNRMTVFEMLQMPFYHPTLEEGLRSALRDAARQLPAEERPSEMLLCESSAEPPLC